MMRITKKYLALSLVFIMSFALLSGCGVPTSADKFSTLMDEVSKLKECSMETVLSFDFAGELDPSVGGGESASLTLNGWISHEKKLAAGTVAIKIKADAQTIELDLTDYVVDQNKLYFNVDSIMSAVGSFMGQPIPEGTLGAKYVVLELEELVKLEEGETLDTWNTDTTVEQALPKEFEGIVNKAVKYIGEEKLYSENDNSVIFTMTSQNFLELLKIVLEDVSANAATYLDAVITYIKANPVLANQYGPDITAIESDKEATVTTMKSSIDEILADYEAQTVDFPKMSVTNSIVKDKDTYSFDMLFAVEERGSLNATQKYGPLTEDISSFTAPQDAISLEDAFTALTGTAY